MIRKIKGKLLQLSATVLNYLSVYGFNYRKLLSDVTYEKFFESSE